MRSLPYLVALAVLVPACSASTMGETTGSPAGTILLNPSAPCSLAAAPPRVQLFGGVKRPGTLAYEPGLTVFGAIRRAGGLEPSAVAHQVRIVRCGHALGPFMIPAAPGAQTDLLLERGDVLDIPVELF